MDNTERAQLKAQSKSSCAQLGRRAASLASGRAKLAATPCNCTCFDWQLRVASLMSGACCLPFAGSVGPHP